MMGDKTRPESDSIETFLTELASAAPTPGGGGAAALAGALRTLDLANDEIDELDSTTIPATSRYGNETLVPHPVFKIQKDAQDSVTRQMKALGLTAEELTGTDEDDPLIDLTKKVKNVGRKKPNIIKRNTEPTE